MLAAAAMGGALLACAREPAGKSSDAASGQERIEPAGSEAADAVDLAAVITQSLVAQQGSCLPTAPAPGRSRLIYSLLPSQASYLRLTVVTSPDGARPVMVDLARGLTGGRILYATLAPGAGLVRLQTFRSASDRHPLVTDLPLGDPAAQHLLVVGERALTLPCRGV